MTRARSLSKLVNAQSFTVDNDFNVGVNSTLPVEKLNVVGVVSATSFFGDGSNLDGVASAGLGTALSEEGAGSVIYYTDTTLGIGSTVNVDPPSTTDIAYTQYEEVSLTGDADLIVAEGDDFVPDILGLSDGALSDRIGSGSGGISHVVEDTTPQLGGDLDLNNQNITGVGNININGIFTGNGSGLTNVSAVGTGIGVSNSGTNVGTAQTIDFGTGVTISSVSSGLATVTVSTASTADVSTGTLNVVGFSTFNGTTLINGTNKLNFNSNSGQEGQIYATSEYLYINSSASTGIFIQGNGFVNIRSDSGEDMFKGIENGAVELYYDDVKKIETATDGVYVAGIVTASTHVDSGIVTYRGDSSYAAAGRWVLGADGSNHYTFTGPGLGHSTLNDPTLYLMRGQTYMFENKMGAHPFRIQITSNGSTGTQWNVGVTNNDVSNGVLIFEVPFNCPNTLYYQCTAHPNMGGALNIVT